MSYVAGDTITLWIALRDGSGAAITTAVDGDFTDTLRHVTNQGTVTTPTVGAWAHVSNGLYSATISSALAGTYAGIVDYNGTPDQPFVFDIPVASTAATIETSDPVASGGDVTLYQADHYDADESRSLDWSTTDAATWPTLTSATITFVARHTRDASSTISATGSVVVATGATKQVRVELTPALTSALTPGDYDYQVIATLSNGHVVTLAAGDLTLTKRVSAT